MEYSKIALENGMHVPEKLVIYSTKTQLCEKKKTITQCYNSLSLTHNIDEMNYHLHEIENFSYSLVAYVLRLGSEIHRERSKHILD